MDRPAFDLYIETQLAPTLQPGDVVILDNLKVRASTQAADALKERGTWFLFLPAHSPDLNPIEDALWRAVGDICSLFEPRERWSFLSHAGYAAD